MAEEQVKFPMPGKVIKVNVSEGDVVQKGGTICVLESMKMEIQILAPVAGRVTAFKVSVGQHAKGGGLVAIIEY